jgi:hypothetical protein
MYVCMYLFIYVVCMYVHKYICMFVCMTLVNFTLDGSDRLLRALVTVVVAMVPPPEELLRLHKDDAKALVEKIQAVIVLKKGAEMSRFHVFQHWHLILRFHVYVCVAKFGAYEDIQSVPEWLERAIQYLSLTDSALQKVVVVYPYTHTVHIHLHTVCTLSYPLSTGEKAIPCTHIHSYIPYPYLYSYFISFLYPNLNSPETGRSCIIYFGAILQWLTCKKFISS